MKRTFFWTILFLSTLQYLNSCAKQGADESVVCECYDPSNPDCVNYDPCYGVLPTTADFDILEQFSSVSQVGDSFTYTDSFSIVKDISGFGMINFVAKEKEALHYTWYLGTEVIEDSDQITRWFAQPDLTSGTEITVTLVVEKHKSVDCLPDNDPIDTVTKKFTLVEPCDYLVNGLFRGAWLDENGADSFNIRIQTNNGYGGEECTQTYGWNFNNRMKYGECDSVSLDVLYSNSSFIDFRAFTSCGLPHDSGVNSSLERSVLVYNPLTNKFRMTNTYWYFVPNSQKIIKYNKIFVGNRLN